MVEETDRIFQCLQLWLQITGHDPEARQLYLSELHQRQGCQELKESQELDETGVTTAMLLNHFLQCYEEERTFTLKDLASDNEEMWKCVQATRELKKHLSSEAITKHVAAFRTSLRKVLVDYKVESEEVYKTVSDDSWMAVIRRNSLRSFNDLREHQFLKGEFSEEHPKFIPDVLQAWNINSLLEITAGMPGNCIALCMMRNSIPELSYFVFVVKNNSNIWVLTDKTPGAHPEQHRMSRRKDRDFEKRVLQNHFPYQLLDFEFTEKSVIFKKTTALAVRQVEAVPMKKIKDLEADQVIWITLMMDMIKGKYFKQKYESPKLSYTAEMIKEPQSLLDCEAASYLPVKGYQPLNLKPLTIDDVTSDKLAGTWGMTETNQNAWMEKRYIAKTKEEHLNLLVPTGTPANELIIREEKDNRYFHSWDSERCALKLKSADPAEFGDAEQLEKYRIWYARHNLALSIKKHADEEFEARKDEIEKWYRERIEANMPVLQMAIAKKEFFVVRQEEEQGRSFASGVTHYKDCRANILKVNDKSDYLGCGYNRRDFFFSNGYEKKGDFFRCYLNSARYSYIARFSPDRAQDLASLCGVSLNELPDVLQCWTQDEQYYGNNLLNNIDPMEWACKNPWYSIKFDVYIALSKSSLTALEKKAAQK